MSESKFCFWFGRADKFDKVCCTTGLWLGSDSNVVLMQCRAKFIIVKRFEPRSSFHKSVEHDRPGEPLRDCY